MRRHTRVSGVLVLGVGLALVMTSVVSANDDAQYKIVMSKNQELCAKVRDVLNDDLGQYGPGYDPRKFGAQIFSAITWTGLGGQKEGFDYYGEVARFDVNNDGKMDIVVRQETSGLKDKTFQMLFVFEDDQYPELAKREGG